MSFKASLHLKASTNRHSETFMPSQNWFLTLLEEASLSQLREFKKYLTTSQWIVIAIAFFFFIESSLHKLIAEAHN